jgi:hypothetical protein
LYEGRGWNKIQDHINFVISRLQYGLNDVRQALEHIECVLIRRPLKAKLQQQQQQSLQQLQNSFSSGTSENHHHYQHHHHHHRRHHQPNPVVSSDFLNETLVLKDFIAYSNSATSEQPIVKSLPIIPLPSVNVTTLQVNLAPSEAKKLRFGSILASTSIDSPNANAENFIEPLVAESSCSSSLADLVGVDNKTKEIWQKLEECAYVHAYRTPLPILFKPHTTLFTKYTDNKQMPKVIIDEPVDLLFTISNNLRISLLLGEITPLWKFLEQTQPSVADESTSVFEASNELDDSTGSTIVECSSISELNMSAGESYKLRLRLVPRRAHGHLHVLGIKYRLTLGNSVDTLSASTSMQSMISTAATTLSNVLPVSSFSLQSTNSIANENESTLIDNSRSLYGKQLFELRGPRLNNTSQAMRSLVYDTDNRLNLKIVNKAPLLQVEMDRLPTEMICGQIERIKLFIINTSNQMSIGNLRIVSHSIEQSNLWFSESKSSKIMLQNDRMSSFSKSEFKLADATSNESGAENKSGYTVFSYTHSHSAALDKASRQPPPSSLLDQANELIYNLEGVTLKPNEHYELDMFIRAPESNNNTEHKFRLLFFYDEASSVISNQKTISHAHVYSSNKRNSSSTNTLKYRIIRCEFSIKTLKCLNMFGVIRTTDSNSSRNMLINSQIANQSSIVSLRKKNFFSKMFTLFAKFIDSH